MEFAAAPDKKGFWCTRYSVATGISDRVGCDDGRFGYDVQRLHGVKRLCTDTFAPGLVGFRSPLVVGGDDCNTLVHAA